MISIAVAGASGYAGGEALRLLLNHPGYGQDFEIGALTGASNAGQRFGSLVPGLPQLADRIVEATTEDVLANHDVAILALPHGVSSSLDLGGTVVLDCGADRRLSSEADWDAYYGGSYPGSWPYGIPELPGNRPTIAAASGVAVPGCFPTGATLALLPGMAAGLISPEVSVVSVTGVTGAGKKPAVELLGGETMGNLRAYKVGTHRHTPEIAQNIRRVLPSGGEVRVTFTPVLAPLGRGILTTVTAQAQGSAAELRSAYEDFCAGEPFLHLLPEGEQPEVKSVVGTNMAHIQVTVADGVVVATSAIDNLTKGTAGAAVQCLNLIQGWNETAGLPMAGL
ncbi:N-acetyl-gamma-glutamyl-phosphate reductase [Corynebacterium glyciniphilum]|uniref:N-acetyl-gamma-glutamyl-phosphate reductase n=1 Tax=Corynebacterium glyciniphilum AJ 3170 TaxID=1404245 RepID=X5DSP9_9CORY|nr:N-acetyl-gamma-glutamyl-phosphate reductase [Corynebacterium glyciniphilum]AHW64299.1 N-acetyl-gamma-glutamyl-phosphate reductase [Corynebacterium glyciniphilum AJ 3170]